MIDNTTGWLPHLCRAEERGDCSHNASGPLAEPHGFGMCCNTAAAPSDSLPRGGTPARLQKGFFLHPCLQRGVEVADLALQLRQRPVADVHDRVADATLLDTLILGQG